MAFILKVLGRTRFGLMVVTLFLLAGLFPQRAIGENGDGAPTEAGTETAIPRDGSGHGHLSDTNGTNAEGLSDKNVKCYKCSGPKGSECHTAPDTLKTECRSPNGYCFQEIEEATRYVKVNRDCANEDQVKCLKDKPNMCSILDSSVEDEALKLAELTSCIHRMPLTLRDAADPKSTDARSGTKKAELKKTICLCKTDRCNTRTSGGNVGRGDHGFVCAVVAVALLMTSKATPLRGILVGFG